MVFYVIWTVVILKNKNTIFNTHILSFKPLVFIGKISYSFYIWHQAAITTLRSWGHDYKFELGMGLIVIGVLTYYFIEDRIRISKHPFVVPAILIFGGIILVAGLLNSLARPLSEREISVV
jgi:peptidoglycan/LPS O-acetylase OafA/YrhL